MEISVELTKEQLNVLYNVTNDIQSGKQEVKIGGFAGTGKTTLIRYLSKIFPDFGVCAFTGKAANVLRKKKVSATTIHSRIYVPIMEYGTLIGFEKAEIEQLDCSGFLVDESSMVSKSIYQDLSSYGLPCIYVGDHGQLEPIGTDFNLMKTPTYKLEKIHRNAGEIARFAQHLRNGKNAIGFQCKNKVRFINKYKVTDDHLAQADQIICAYNATRVDLNKRVRAILGYQGDPKPGERIICLRNNKMFQLFNGMQGVVKKVYENQGRTLLDFDFDDTTYYGIWYEPSCFNVEKPQLEFDGLDGPNPFDFAYAITAHKAQGDEFNKGLVYEQRCKHWNHWRWAYTAASRFKISLDWVLE